MDGDGEVFWNRAISRMSRAGSSLGFLVAVVDTLTMAGRLLPAAKRQLMEHMAREGKLDRCVVSPLQARCDIGESGDPAAKFELTSRHCDSGSTKTIHNISSILAQAGGVGWHHP